MFNIQEALQQEVEALLLQPSCSPSSIPIRQPPHPTETSHRLADDLKIGIPPEYKKAV